MEERERQARRGAGGRASALARWVPFLGVSAAVAVVLVTPAAAGSGVLADAEVTANSNNTFTPATLEVSPGDTVTWRNAGGFHDVVFEDGPRHPPGGASSDPWSYPRTFTQTGIYRYYCSQHGTLNSGMRGSVTVVTALPPPGGTPPPPGGGTPPPPGGGTPPPGGGGNPPPGGGGGGGGDPGGGGGGGSPGGRLDTTVTLKVSDATPARGARVRFFGTVRPERDGRMLQLQRRRGRSYVTVTRIRLTEAGSTRSKFSKRVRIVGDAVFRARLPADSDHLTGVSRTKRLNVP
jgi:plastocyanin